METDSKTLAWRYYEQGRAYNCALRPSLYTTVNTNIEFFTGNQWRNLPSTRAMAALPKPVFNIIKRITSLFVASLTASAVTLRFDPLRCYDGENLADPETDASAYATAEVQNLFEKFKMEYRVREALFDAAQTGDYCAHFYWDPDAMPYGGAFGPYRGEIRMELVDGVNVMFGNPNTPEVERQPYILIVGRDTVANLRAEQARHRRKNDLSSIQPDSETDGQAGQGGGAELHGETDSEKCLFVYLYTKRAHRDPGTGETVTTVHVTKATRTAVIYENVDTGLTRYPVAWGNWERQKNQYHGRALVTGIIPNQIFINSMFAMVMRHLQLMGFPKTIYNQDLIGQWNNEVGQAIGVRGLPPGQAIGQVATNMQTADMSAQIFYAIDKAMEYTKECLGVTDVQMGSVRPDNTSALMVLQSNAEVPLENTRSLLYQWVEDIGAILLDMMGTYYGERPIVHDKEFVEPVLDQMGVPSIDPVTGKMMTKMVTRKVSELFDFRQFKHLWLNVSVNVGATTFYSEIAMVQTLDNLRREGTLEIIDYLERVPDKLIPKKAELIATMKRRAEAAQQAQGTLSASDEPPVTMGGGGPGGPGGAVTGSNELDTAKRVQNMPQNIQQNFNNLPTKAQNALLKVGAGKNSV